jgi:hypothetical protein
MNTNIELTRRWYDTGEEQWLAKVSQNWRLSQNSALQLKYDYSQKSQLDIQEKNQTLKAMIHYYL